MTQILFILALICFAIGTIPAAAGMLNINWTNAGLAFLTLTLLLG